MCHFFSSFQRCSDTIISLLIPILIPGLWVLAIDTSVGLKNKEEEEEDLKCFVAGMLVALSDSSEINFFFRALKTVVARGSTVQLPVLALGAINFRCVTLSRA